jgi:voltage-gated potassium channel
LIFIIMGAMICLIEGEKKGFTCIPRSIFRAIATLTTAGYGDLAPKTVPGHDSAALHCKFC